MIEIKGLYKSYQSAGIHLQVLKGIDLTIKQGEMVSIMGSSGSGKSTLLNIIGLLDDADSGLYSLDGVAMQNLNETLASRYRNKYLGFIFQSFHLITYKSALENVELPLFYQGMVKKERKSIAMHYLAKVGLVDWSHHLPHELSGGQRQRVAIARAMASDPKVILADEPTGALDAKTSFEIIDLMQELNAEGKTFVIVTHDSEVANMCKRVVRLKDGVIIADNKVEIINSIANG